ncbi:MAG: hypothetical protein OEY18_17955 [Candidatus Aminicenantes bacterium]|nr:hypothetical protein [Candidatus Aminicenantes bacterium]MDH5662332.1 hypothetical protein [Elusimicrobiota bacterium]
MRKKIAIFGLILIMGLAKLVMAEVCERIVPYGSPPGVRDGHALISSMGGNEQFLFGGFDQNTNLWVLRYEGDTWRWENMGTKAGDPPSARGGHSGIFVPKGGGQDYIIVFGGSGSFLGDPVDIVTYQLENPWDYNSEWKKFSTEGSTPTARAEHTAVYEFNESKMVVFGGYDNSKVASSDTFALDFSFTPASWTLVNIPGVKPDPRYGHSAVRGTDGIMVFGGKDNGEFFNDCWRLRLWDKEWEEMSITGDKPPARWQHSAVWMDPSPGETGGMLIFGGQDENGEYLDDFWILREPDLGVGEFDYRWERIYPIGDLPSGRRGHAAGAGWGWAGERMMYIFGGFDGNENLNDVYVFFKGEEVEKSLEEKPFNAPNPFNPDTEDTKICYYLEEDDDVKIKLFTLTGELVYSWENISGKEGLNQWPWNGKNEKGKIVENGGYICLIEAGGKKQKCKIAVLR